MATKHALGPQDPRAPTPAEHAIPALTSFSSLPPLLTADEVAAVLRTSRKAIYARAERGQLPGAIRDGRRLLVERDVLLAWIRQRRVSVPGQSDR